MKIPSIAVAEKKFCHIIFHRNISCFLALVVCGLLVRYRKCLNIDYGCLLTDFINVSFNFSIHMFNFATCLQVYAVPRQVLELC